MGSCAVAADTPCGSGVPVTEVCGAFISHLTGKWEHNSQEEVPRCGFLSLPELGKARDASQGSVSRDSGCVNPPQRDRPSPTSLGLGRCPSQSPTRSSSRQPSRLKACSEGSGGLLIKALKCSQGPQGPGQNLSTGTVCGQERRESRRTLAHAVWRSHSL